METPLTKRLRYTLNQARDAFNNGEEFTRKWDLLPHGLEVHIQFETPHVLKLAIARTGPAPADITPFEKELQTVIAHWPEIDTRPTGETQLIESFSERYWLITYMHIAKQLEMFPP